MSIENLYVSDLFGNNITDESPVIIINVNKPQNYMIKISEDISENTNIWKYDKNAINEVLSKRNVDHNNFLELGHVLNKFDQNNNKNNNKNNLPKILILANKNICSTPEQYEEVMNYSTGKIIRPYKMSPTGEKKYTMALFYIDNKKEKMFDMSNIGIISDKLLINSGKTSTNYNLDSNEFGLLTTLKFGFKTIARTQIIKDKFKLSNKDDKYLTIFENNALAKQGLSTLSQTFSYNAQGELINEGQCLTYKNSKIMTESCNKDNPNQKWTVTQNKILPSNNLGKCLDVSSLDKTTAQLNECDSSDTQIWDTEIENNSFNSDISDSISSKSGDYIWSKFKGKTIALVENSNPWFVNKDIVDNIDTTSEASTKFMETQNEEIPHYQPNFLIDLRNNENYKSDFILDPSSPTLGHGYSFSSRSKNQCQNNNSKIERFEGEIDDSNQNKESRGCTFNKKIAMFIVIIVILLIFYKIWIYYCK